MEGTVDEFSTEKILFEPATGYVGTALDSMPEPITAITIDGYVKVDEKGRVSEGYWLKAVDEDALRAEPQAVMHSFEFMAVSRLCAAIFAACGRPDKEEGRVGLGYTAYYNELARRLDPTLSNEPQRNLACTVSGFADRGASVKFSTSDGGSTPIAAFQGRLAPNGMHTMARGFRDMAEWRASAIDASVELSVKLRAAAKAGMVTERSTVDRRASEMTGPRR